MLCTAIKIQGKYIFGRKAWRLSDPQTFVCFNLVDLKNQGQLTVCPDCLVLASVRSVLKVHAMYNFACGPSWVKICSSLACLFTFWPPEGASVVDVASPFLFPSDSPPSSGGTKLLFFYFVHHMSTTNSEFWIYQFFTNLFLFLKCYKSSFFVGIDNQLVLVKDQLKISHAIILAFSKYH